MYVLLSRKDSTSSYLCLVETSILILKSAFDEPIQSVKQALDTFEIVIVQMNTTLNFAKISGLLSNEVETTYTQCTEAGDDVFLQPGIEDRLLD